METVRGILAAHHSGISKPGLLAWARLRIDTAMTEAQLDEELARLGDEVVDLDGFLYLVEYVDASRRPVQPDYPASEAEGSRPEPSQSPDWTWSRPAPARVGRGGIGKVVGVGVFLWWLLSFIGGLIEPGTETRLSRRAPRRGPRAPRSPGSTSSSASASPTPTRVAASSAGYRATSLMATSSSRSRPTRAPRSRANPPSERSRRTSAAAPSPRTPGSGRRSRRRFLVLVVTLGSGVEPRDPHRHVHARAHERYPHRPLVPRRQALTSARASRGGQPAMPHARRHRPPNCGGRDGLPGAGGGRGARLERQVRQAQPRNQPDPREPQRSDSAPGAA